MRSPCSKESAQRYPRNPDFSTTPIAPLTILRHETITKAALEFENRVASQEAEGKSPAQPEPHANRISANRFDDLLEEEREAVQIAIRRLSSQESYDRIYRIRRATQCSYQHKLLPKEDWTTAEEVTYHFLLRPSTVDNFHHTDWRKIGYPVPSQHHRSGRG